ncbi:MAG: UDP-3-O-acyl-N-acetylglucosamine deacetylase [Alphaproteobacteria bacterium]|nr:UDP-3-O-acyl-N-acetylglucosamine deacetylase [Alphaproteobacteria bacterium]
MFDQGKTGQEAPQRTLKSAIPCAGIGLHSGRRVHMTLAPAAPDTGIVFVRTDLIADGASEAAATIPARFDTVVDIRLCTRIANDQGATVGTIEHLMSALRGVGIDNLRVEVDAPELPVMDGSAAPFVFLIDCAGTVDQPVARRGIRILKTIEVTDADKTARLSPGAGCRFGFEIAFASPAIGRQAHDLALEETAFREAIADARTFGFAEEAAALQAAGLARGASLDNAVVVEDDRVINPGGLRHADEFVRHKILDAVGDLYLAGAPILGHYHGHKAGHGLNNRLLHALFADAQAWCWEICERRDWADAPALARSA